MKYLHTMIRVFDLDKSLDFYVNKLGLKEISRREVPQGKFTLIFLATELGAPELELTYNWQPSQAYDSGRNFGHLAYQVDNIYQTCERLQAAGVTILRPPRCGHMAFVKCPDGISIELLQNGPALSPQAPWTDMENSGSW
jgi:lactoylglutathione lyase